MAIAVDDVYRLTVAGSSGSQVLNNVWFLRITAAPIPPITPAQVAEAWWNDKKVLYRGMVTNVWTQAFLSVAIEQVDVAVAGFGVYAIPAGEQAGTRVPAVAPGNVQMNTFSAIGMRLNVSTRATRPGQKRFWGLSEGDVLGNNLEAPAAAAAVAFGATLASTILFGAPALSAEAKMIVRASGADNVPQVHQDITGASVSLNVRSQVSRRVAPY